MENQDISSGKEHSQAQIGVQRPSEFSWRTRADNLKRLKGVTGAGGSEVFDLLVVGGGITGVGVAREAAYRGLKVALVEQADFASGTSSKSSKLIHGGLRYLENLEFGLVFEALAERTHLLNTVPSLVRPLKFYMPIYDSDRHGRTIIGMGLWLYDLLALFRAPGFHRSLSARKLSQEVPGLATKGLRGGFQYYDASMWDDGIVVQVARSAADHGALLVNYVKAIEPVNETRDPRDKTVATVNDGQRVKGFWVQDQLDLSSPRFAIRAHHTVICAGPWLDHLGHAIDPSWKPHLQPSKGVHLLFDLKRLPLSGALVMSHPSDGRIAFVIPRKDMGSGVVIVGTTDGPAPADPAKVRIEWSEVQYLMTLLQRYFPKLGLTTSDILSAYVGVRPLVTEQKNEKSVAGEVKSARALQKVSREHWISTGPGGVTLVGGGKYTTFQTMAKEIVHYAMNVYLGLKDHDEKNGDAKTAARWRQARTSEGARKTPLSPWLTPESVQAGRDELRRRGQSVPEEVIQRYGGEAVFLAEDRGAETDGDDSPSGFGLLESQLRYSMKHEMVVRLEDFWLRRLPLYLARADHSIPWLDRMSRIWAVERGLPPSDGLPEAARLRQKIEELDSWRTK